MTRKTLLIISLVTSLLVILFAASYASKDTSAPAITNTTTSSKFFAKSDCSPTSLTITADIKDGTEVKSATVWYRVGVDQKFTSTNMKHESNDLYTVMIIGLDIPGGEYGVLEFYVVAKDEAGNQSQSPVDASVQLLPCVAH